MKKNFMAPPKNGELNSICRWPVTSSWLGAIWYDDIHIIFTFAFLHFHFLSLFMFTFCLRCLQYGLIFISYSLQTTFTLWWYSFHIHFPFCPLSLSFTSPSSTVYFHLLSLFPCWHFVLAPFNMVSYSLSLLFTFTFFHFAFVHFNLLSLFSILILCFGCL